MGEGGEGVSPAPGSTSLFEWFFRSRVTGEITIAQFPNAALWVFLAATVARWLVEASGPLGTVLGWLARGALIVWAVDELVRGANPWRRTLGATVLAWQVTAIVVG